MPHSASSPTDLDAVAPDSAAAHYFANALRDSEARYQHIAANVPGVVYQFAYRADGTRGYTFVSEGSRILFGIAPADALANPALLIELIPEEDGERARFLAMARDAATSLSPFRWEGRVVLHNGEERHVQVAARAARQPDGTVVSDGLMMDITELHQATRRLEEKEQLYRSLFDNNPDGVYHLDLDMNWISLNPACAAVSGFSEEEFISGRVTPVTVEEDLPRAIAGFHAACEGSAQRFDVHIRHRSGHTVPVGITNIPIVVGSKVTGVFGIAKDLTAQRALEDRLRQAQKMEAVGRLAGGIAHDFNNLLMVIQSYGGFVAAELPAGSVARNDLNELLAASTRAQELTRQLLAFGRKQVLKPRQVDVNRKVSGVAGMLRRIIGEDIALETELAPEPWSVLADPGQLEQVLMNLAVNARDAMPDGGTLRLRTENRTGNGSAKASGQGEPEGRYVALVVEDTGVGIPADVLPRIFEPFFTTKPVGSGTGLGLATVYGIVEQSGGMITADSTPGAGSRFTVMLPAVDVAETTDAADVRSALPSGTETVLLVEDEEKVRAALRRMLEQQGYAVLEAGGGTEALRIVDDMAISRTGRIDLVITDVVMPEGGGNALGQVLASSYPEIPVLYMSGYTDDEIFRRGLSDVDATFLEKPFTADRLGEQVRNALNARGNARRR